MNHSVALSTHGNNCQPVFGFVRGVMVMSGLDSTVATGQFRCRRYLFCRHRPRNPLPNPALVGRLWIIFSAFGNVLSRILLAVLSLRVFSVVCPPLRGKSIRLGLGLPLLRATEFKTRPAGRLLAGVRQLPRPIARPPALLTLRAPIKPVEFRPVKFVERFRLAATRTCLSFHERIIPQWA